MTGRIQKCEDSTSALVHCRLNIIRMYDLEPYEIEWAVDEASGPGLTRQQQAEFAAMPYYDVREALAGNPTIAASTFRALSEDPHLTEVLAENPACPSDVLERFALSSYIDVRRHPNADRVVKGFSDTDDRDTGEYWYDPVDDWVKNDWREAEQALWRKHDEYRDLYYSYEPDATQIRREYLLEHWSLALPMTPEHVLERIVEKLTPRLKNRKPLSSDKRALPISITSLKNADDVRHVQRVLWLVARHPNATAVLLTNLADLGYVMVCREVARHPNASLPTLKRLLALEDQGVAVAVAKHPNAKVRKLYGELKGRWEDVQVALARNPHLSDWQLDDLYETGSTAVLKALAGNPAYQPRDAEAFAGNNDPNIRAMAACNPGISQEALRRLASDPNAVVRLAAARNTRAPEDVLVKLYATDTQALPALAGNSATPEVLLVGLARDATNHVQLASNRNIPAHLQQELALSNAIDVARTLARNTGTTPETLALLAMHQDIRVQMRVSRHASAPTEALKTLLEADKHWMARFTARRRLENEAGDMDAAPPSAASNALLDSLDFSF